METAGSILAKLIREKDPKKQEKLVRDLEKQSEKQLGTKVEVSKGVK